MTRQEKERKIKLICLIMMCSYVKYLKQPPKTIPELLQFGLESVYWINELRTARSQPSPRFENGGVAIIGDGSRPEAIQRKDGTIINLP